MIITRLLYTNSNTLQFLKLMNTNLMFSIILSYKMVVNSLHIYGFLGDIARYINIFSIYNLKKIKFIIKVILT